MWVGPSGCDNAAYDAATTYDIRQTTYNLTAYLLHTNCILYTVYYIPCSIYHLLITHDLLSASYYDSQFFNYTTPQERSSTGYTDLYIIIIP